MSNLVVSNISDGTTSVGTGYVVNGSAKAWANFDASGTPSFRVSLNCSSLTDVGTGLFDVNFTSSMNTSEYVLSGGAAAGLYGVLYSYDSIRTASKLRTYLVYATDFGGGGAGYDYTTAEVKINGDLA